MLVLCLYYLDNVRDLYIFLDNALDPYFGLADGLDNVLDLFPDLYDYLCPWSFLYLVLVLVLHLLLDLVFLYHEIVCLHLVRRDLYRFRFVFLGSHLLPLYLFQIEINSTLNSL